MESIGTIWNKIHNLFLIIDFILLLKTILLLTCALQFPTPKKRLLPSKNIIYSLSGHVHYGFSPPPPLLVFIKSQQIFPPAQKLTFPPSHFSAKNVIFLWLPLVVLVV